MDCCVADEFIRLKHLTGSEATVLFLKLMDYATSSFLDKTLTPLERIYKLWFVVFALRDWREWLIKHDAYDLGDNFFSLNAYLCCEINAHSMITIIGELKKNNEDTLFMPWLFSSQSCEGRFSDDIFKL